MTICTYSAIFFSKIFKYFSFLIFREQLIRVSRVTFWFCLYPRWSLWHVVWFWGVSWNRLGGQPNCHLKTRGCPAQLRAQPEKEEEVICWCCIKRAGILKENLQNHAIILHLLSLYFCKTIDNNCCVNHQSLPNVFRLWLRKKHISNEMKKKIQEFS